MNKNFMYAAAFCGLLATAAVQTSEKKSVVDSLKTGGQTVLNYTALLPLTVFNAYLTQNKAVRALVAVVWVVAATYGIKTAYDFISNWYQQRQALKAAEDTDANVQEILKMLEALEAAEAEGKK